MATVGIGGCKAVIPQCPDCKEDLRFDGMGDIMGFLSGKRVNLSCQSCDKDWLSQKDRGVIRHVRNSKHK